jgi:hypothetical protein
MPLPPTEHDTDKDDAPMGDTYIRLNDALPEHRKIVAVGGDAAWLHICGLAYCSRNLSDGLVPMGLVPRLSDRKQPMKLAAKLTEANLWHTVGHDCERCPQPSPDEYVIHDYLQHQRSAEHVEAIKKKRAEAGRVGGTQKAANASRDATAEAQQTSSNLLDGCYDDAEANGTPEAVTEAEAEEVLRTSQTETDFPPSAGANAQGAELMLIAVDGPKPKRTRRKPETPTPEIFPVTADMRAWATGHTRGITVNLDHETERFLNHARQHDRRCRDWHAAWRNWVLKAQDFADQNRPPAATGTDGPRSVRSGPLANVNDLWRNRR